MGKPRNLGKTIYSQSILGALTELGEEIAIEQDGISALSFHAVFAWGSAGTTCKAFVQTSIDGVAWADIICFAFGVAVLSKIAAVNTHAAIAVVTPTDAALADNTLVSGFIGDRVRVKRVSVGTYVATTLNIYMMPQ